MVLHSLCESHGPMGPGGPAIWFKCPSGHPNRNDFLL